MKPSVLFLVQLLSIAIIHAQDGPDVCKDHPFFNRVPNFIIADCDELFGTIPFTVADGGSLQKEGNVKQIKYSWPDNSSKKAPTLAQLIKSYEGIVSRNGGKKIYACSNCTDDHYGATFNLYSNGKTYWIKIAEINFLRSELKSYSLVILATEEEEKDVEDEGGGMYDELDRTGRIALYINFETGKSIIKPESESIISAIEQVLSDYPTLVISIEGHTDNVGNPASNKTLSLARANAVINALVKNGVDRNRLSAKGWGQEKPVENNQTDEGRARNRRVEIVKIKE